MTLATLVTHIWQTVVKTSGVIAHVCKTWHVVSFDRRDENVEVIFFFIVSVSSNLWCLALGMIDIHLPPLHCKFLPEVEFFW